MCNMFVLIFKNLLQILLSTSQIKTYMALSLDSSSHYKYSIFAEAELVNP